MCSVTFPGSGNGKVDMIRRRKPILELTFVHLHSFATKGVKVGSEIVAIFKAHDILGA